MNAPIPLTWATKIIERMHLLYGAAFMRQWDGLDKAQMVQAWAQELSGFTGEEIAAGLNACRTRPYAPSLPEFMRLCRPWLEPETAFRAAVTGMQARSSGKSGEWPHPAVFWTAVEIGQYDMLNQSWQTLKGRWETAYSIHLGKGQWELVPDVSPALPAPPPASREDAEKAMRQMGAGEVLKQTKDHKAWARKILASPRGRPLVAIQMAQRALEA